MTILANLLPIEHHSRFWSLKYSLRRDGASMDTLLDLCSNNHSYYNHSNQKNRQIDFSSSMYGQTQSQTQTSQITPRQTYGQTSGQYSQSNIQTPCIIIIEDSWGYIFGGFITNAIENKSTYYGTGESFLYTLIPKINKYEWTGNNYLFILSNSNSLAMGGGGSGYGFCIDDELDTGISNNCDTYNNEQLSSSEFFKTLNVEIWYLENDSILSTV